MLVCDSSLNGLRQWEEDKKEEGKEEERQWRVFMSMERVSIMMILKAGVAWEMLQLDSMCVTSSSFFFFLNYISYMSTSPSSHHDHFINNIYFFPCCILGIVLSVSHLYLQILLQVRLPWSELELQIWDFKQNFARNCCLLFFSFFSLSCSLFLSLSCFSNLTLFPPANYQLILVNYLLIVFLAMARS